MTEHDDRREHPRFPLRVFAEFDKQGRLWAVHVLDISYHGARVAILDDNNFAVGDEVKFNIELPGDSTPGGVPLYLHLDGVVAHRKKHILGIAHKPIAPQDIEVLNYVLANFK